MALSREERGILRHGRVAWLTAFQPITVAGPRPIHTAFPASLACKLKFECMTQPLECQCMAGNGTLKMARKKKRRGCSAVLPVGLALFHQRAQAFLRILKAIKLIQENVHRMLEALAQRQAHAPENCFLRHGQHWTRMAANSGHKIVHRLLELSLRHEAIYHAEFQRALRGHWFTRQNKLERDLSSDEIRKNRGCERRKDADADFRLGKPGLRGGNHEIAESRQLRAAADSRSVHHADHGLANFQHSRERRVKRVEHLKNTLRGVFTD